MLESLNKKGSSVPKLAHPMFDGWIEKLEEEDYWEMNRLLREFAASKSSFMAGEVPTFPSVLREICANDESHANTFHALLVRQLLAQSPDVWFVADDGDDPVLATYLSASAVEELDRDNPYALGVSGAIEECLKAYRKRRSAFLTKLGVVLGADSNKDASNELNLIRRLSMPLLKGIGALASKKSQADAAAAVKKLVAESHEPGTGLNSQLLRGNFFAVWDEMTLSIAEDAGKLIDRASRRMLDLLPLLECLEPSRPAAQFLQRVSRCYIYGFDSECAILCRSVLDAEFVSLVSNDECIEVLGSRRSLQFNLTDRIATALKKGSITFEGGEAAREVTGLGNKLVHATPAHNVDALHVIKLTLNVMRELHAD
jgi:hypothetical protein